MGKKINFLSHFLYYSLLTLALSLGLALAILQTPYAKNKIIALIEKQAEVEGFVIHLNTIDGYLPVFWHMDELSFNHPRFGMLVGKQVRIRLALYPLLRGKLIIKNLQIEELTITPSEQETPWEWSPDLALQTVSFFREVLIKKIYFNNSLSPLYLSLHHSVKRKEETLLLKMGHVPSGSLFEIAAKKRNKIQALDLLASLDVENPAYLPFFQKIREELGPFSLQVEASCSLAASHPYYTEVRGTTSFKYTPLKEGKGLASLPCAVQSDFILHPQSLTLNNTHIDSPIIHAVVHGAYDFANGDYNYNADLQVENLKNLFTHWDGGFKAELIGDSKSFNLQLNSDDLYLSDHDFAPFQLKSTLQRKDGNWHGDLIASSTSTLLPFNVKADLLVEDLFKIEHLQFEAEDAFLNLSASIGLNSLQASTQFTIANLSPFTNFFEGAPLEGAVKGELTYCQDTDTSLMGHITFQKLRFSDVHFQKVELQTTLSQLSSYPEGSLEFFLKDVSSSSYYIDELKLEGKSIDNGLWNYSLNTHGNRKAPFSLLATGQVEAKPQAATLTLDSLKATVFEKDWASKTKAFLHLEDKELSLQHLDISSDMSHLLCDFSLGKKESFLDLKAVHLPLELITLIVPELPLKGIGSLEAKLEKDQDRQEGNLHFVLEEAQILPAGREYLARGTFDAHLLNQSLQVFAQGRANTKEQFNLQATLPLIDSTQTLDFRLSRQKPFSFQINLDGYIEQIFDFIDLGNQHITGHVKADLLANGTLENPLFQGDITLNQGTYESYSLGTYLEDIAFALKAEKDTLYLNTFSAKDKKKGKATAEGQIQIDSARTFPYQFVVEVNDLEYLDFDRITAVFTGPIYLSGNKNKLQIKGSVMVSRADIRLIDKAGGNIPDLKVEFIHAPKKVERASKQKEALSFDVDLDAELTADSRVYLTGKGLNSEWEGHLSLKTEAKQLLFQGELKMVKGEYLFSGKRFDLKEGDITFSPHASPFVHIKGISEIASHQISIQLQGSLENPTITFSSIPTLPTSSILSYILFNKDVSDISPFQAIQLAQTLVMLSNDSGPGFLEKIQQSLGIDRFNIVSDPRGGDQVAVQIGKYLTQGVMVTLSQSGTSSDVIIEVDLKHGFVFQAESQQQQEGKFSLKWYHHY